MPDKLHFETREDAMNYAKATVEDARQRFAGDFPTASARLHKDRAGRWSWVKAFLLRWRGEPLSDDERMEWTSI